MRANFSIIGQAEASAFAIQGWPILPKNEALESRRKKMKVLEANHCEASRPSPTLILALDLGGMIPKSMSEFLQGGRADIQHTASTIREKVYSSFVGPMNSLHFECEQLVARKGMRLL